MKIIKLIKCWFGFHKYNPAYTQRFLTYGKGKRRHHVKGQFRCIHCKQKTRWLNKKETEAMLESDICDWGIR